MLKNPIITRLSESIITDFDLFRALRVYKTYKAKRYVSA